MRKRRYGLIPSLSLKRRNLKRPRFSLGRFVRRRRKR